MRVRTRSSTSSPRRSWRPETPLGAARARRTRMYGVLSGAARCARAEAVPRLGPDGGLRRSTSRPCGRLSRMPRSCGCAPPTTRPAAPGAEPTWSRCSRPVPHVRAADRSSSSTRPTTSSIPPRSSSCATRYPPLIVVRTLSKAFALPGLRVGYAVAARPTIARLERVPSRRAASPRSRPHVAAAALRRPELAAANAAAIGGRARPARGAPGGHRACRPTRASRTSCSAASASRADAEEATEHLLRTRHRAAHVRCRAPARRTPALHGAGPRDRTSGSCEVLGAWIDGRSAMTERGVPSGRARRARRAIAVAVDLDGSGAASIATGVGFYDHLLTSLAHHSLIDIEISAAGDLEVDEHHTVEDVALALGRRHLRRARRPGRHHPLRRLRACPWTSRSRSCALDLSGRPYAVIDLPFRGERMGDALDPAHRARPGLVRAGGRRDAPLDGRAATTTTSPRPPSRRSPGRCGWPSRIDPRRERRGLDEGQPAAQSGGAIREPTGTPRRGRRLRRRQPREHPQRPGARSAREVRLAARPDDLEDADVILVPGVGASAPAMTPAATPRASSSPSSSGCAPAPGTSASASGSSSSSSAPHEDGAADAGPARGRRRAASRTRRRLPHIGWNRLVVRRPHPVLDGAARRRARLLRPQLRARAGRPGRRRGRDRARRSVRQPRRPASASSVSSSTRSARGPTGCACSRTRWPSSSGRGRDRRPQPPCATASA